MSPEQAYGDRATPATDVYALGIVLFEALTGDPPFNGASALTVARRHIECPPPIHRLTHARVPRYLVEVVRRCLAKDPRDRYGDAGALERALTAPPSSAACAPVLPPDLQTWDAYGF
jgi:serine/threonine-protein kinase